MGKSLQRYEEMHAFEADNKVFTDRHEYHVTRRLTERPMEVLMGDVHTVDLTISEAMTSKFRTIKDFAFSAAVAGETKIKAWLIGWMDGSCGYLWATPILTGLGQGITQQDIALSLYQVLTCSWDGIPKEFIVDNVLCAEWMADLATDHCRVEVSRHVRRMAQFGALVNELSLP